MKKCKKKINKLGKSKIRKADKAIKTSAKVKEVQELVGEVESVKKIISETLYVRSGIAVDLKNFTLMSVPSPKELMNQ